MATKILGIAGHGGKPYDCGAKENGYEEAKLTREIVKLVDKKLNQFECVFDIYDTSLNAYQQCSKWLTAKKFKSKVKKYDLVVELHLNAFKKNQATGTEVWLPKGAKDLAKNVAQEVVDQLGIFFKKRGVKTQDFLVIKTIHSTGTPCFLIEICFIDNEEDMKTFKANMDRIAMGIATAIVDVMKLKKKKTKKETTKKKEEKKTALKYKVGDTVTINAVYGSSTSKTKLKPSKKTGTITDIPNEKAPNPYLLNDGDIGWVNDKCIVKKASTVNTKKNATKKDSSKLVLKNEPLYTTSSTKIVSSKITGTYYKWSNEVVNGRIRITNKKERIGKVGQVTGWIKKK